MDLRRLEVFAKVAELGSFSRAAEALFLTQPTVSEHVRALEEDLGIVLLDRLGRGARPTPAGRLLLDYAQRILALLLGFAQKNRGLTRVLTGDALVHENDRLQHRINQILDRIEAALKQALRIGVLRGELAEGSEVAGAANLLLCFAIGRWQQFVKSEFRRDPTADWPTPWLQLASACGVVPQPIGSAA